MKPLTMRLSLLAGLLLASASEISAPGLPIPALPPQRVIPADAAIRPESGPSLAHRLASPFASERASGQALPSSEKVRAAGYSIPADRPLPPLGRFKLTAYSGPQLGQDRPITASGLVARAGRTVAVDPKVIPLGSRIYIEGVGERIAEDVGGGVKGHHIDVYLPTVPHAKKFGVQRGRTVSLIATPKRDEKS